MSSYILVSMKNKPTPAELQILRVLWRRGPATVRDVHAELNRGGKTGYTTVLKLLQIMADKGIVKRDEAQRAHVYRPAIEQGETQRGLLVDLMDRAFGGSAAALVMQALASKRATPGEIAEIKKMIAKHETGSK